MYERSEVPPSAADFMYFSPSLLLRNRDAALSLECAIRNRGGVSL